MSHGGRIIGGVSSLTGSQPSYGAKVRAPELTGRGWLNTGGKSVNLSDLRGKIVIVDFWTFCCINCLHVLDELRELERQHSDVLVIIGVHSPKFEHEADPAALAAAVDRYEVHHPVLDDPQLTTWSAYGARAWPTLYVIDPEGYIVSQMAGEGHASAIAALVDQLITEHEAKGSLHRGQGPYVPPEPVASTLKFPAKLTQWRTPGTGERGNLLVADSGHHSIAEMLSDGETLVRRIGSGQRGLVDGPSDVARFSEPNGLLLLPPMVRRHVGYDLLVADTVNHALRGVRLSDGYVRTVAGTGEQFMVGGQENVVADAEVGAVTGAGLAGPRAYDVDSREVLPARSVKLSSPWDVAWSQSLGQVVVAMAGNHTLWAFDPMAWDGQGSISLLAGTLNEGLVDGADVDAWFAQPSGLAVVDTDQADAEVLWLADSETSALRRIDLTRASLLTGAKAGVTVTSVVGHGLFDFGHRDGDASQALLQHPLGLALLPDGSVVVADTYNGAIRRYEAGPAGSGGAGAEAGASLGAGGEAELGLAAVAGGHAGAGPVATVTTLATGLAEPSDILVETDVERGSITLLVVESAAHRLTRIALPASLAGEVMDGGARRTQRPATPIKAGAVRLDVPFTPAPGQKLDDRWGPSTSLQVSATPADLLLEGAGNGTDLFRDLVINPEVTSGVLHVTAKAASCDVVPLDPVTGQPDPDVFPACHLAQQDWGVPITVDPQGQTSLNLPLRG